jgi:endonuclease/exonuclease/phosphatase family metal-dependent hydrolase
MAGGEGVVEATAMPAARYSLRLVTLNAHQGVGALRRRGLLAGIRDALRTSAADLVFLQEVGGDDSDAGPEAHYEMLAEEVWPQHAYGRNAVAGSGHQGNALLSKHPIVEWHNVDVSVGRAEPRGLLHCVVAAPGLGGPLHAVCVHLGLRESHRRVQLEHLLAFLARTVPPDAPLALAGDFNDWRETTHRRLIATGLVEVGAGRAGRPARTFPARWPLLRLDRIYLRHLRYQRVELPRRPWSTLSDHAPLAAAVAPLTEGTMDLAP